MPRNNNRGATFFARNKLKPVFLLTIFLIIICSSDALAKCPNCGGSTYESFPSTYEAGHCWRYACVNGDYYGSWVDHSWSNSYDPAPTCTSSGTYKHHCTRDRYHDYEDYVPALGHDFSGQPWQSDANGHWQKCSRCDSTSTKTAHADNNNDGKCDTCQYQMQVAGVITPNPKTLSIVYGNTGSFTYTYNGDGGITVTSSNTTVCNASRSGTTVNITTVGVGSSTITVKAAETTKYKAASATVSVTVTKKGISVPTGTNRTYNGSSQTGLSAGTGYSVGGATTGTNAGSYVATATPTANYMWSDGTTNTRNVSWSIAKKEVSVTWGNQVSWVYDGSVHIPSASAASGVTNETIVLSVVTAQKDVGKYTATASISSVTGGQANKNNYTLKSTTTSKQFEITRKPIAVPTAKTGLVYNGSQQTGVDAGTGYTITGNTGTAAGNYTAVATPTANYMWTDNTYTAKNIAWSIARKGIAKPATSNRTYNRSVQTGVSTGEGYSLTGNPTATEHGTYNVTVTLDSNYQWADGSVTNLSLSWTMYSKNITDNDVTKSISTTTKTYNGSQQTQSISLSYLGVALNLTSEYTVTYTDNVNAGTATITITGQGNYTGTITRTFIINRATQTITLANKTVNYNPNNVPVPIGNAVVTGVNGTILQVPVTYTYYTNSACTTQTTTGDGATGNGQPPAYVGVYYVVVSVAQSQNYNAASKTVTLTINKIDNTLVVAGVQNLRYIEAPQTLVTVSTPQGDVYFLVGSTALNSSNYNTSGSKTIPQGTNAGTYIVQYYTPGTRNYKEKTGSVTVVIIDTYYKDNASPVKYYISLQEAFSQIETGKTLFVMKNVADNTPATLPAGKTVTLELDGKTITASKAGMITNFIFITNNGTLTMQDSSSGKTGTINVTGETTATGLNTRFVQNYGTITVKSGNYNVQSNSTEWVIGIEGNSDNSVINVEGGSIVVTGTTDKNSNIYGINALKGTNNVKNAAVVEAKNTTLKEREWIAGIYTNGQGKATVNITGGTIKGNIGIFFSATDTNAGSSLNVSGANTKIEGNLDGIRNIRAIGGFTITGGTITGGRYGIYQNVNNNITTSANINGGTGSGIRIDSGTCTINIIGGTIKTTATAEDDAIHLLSASNVTLKVTNATITSGSNTYSDAIDKDGGTGDITIDGNSVLTGTQSAIVNQGTGNVIIKNGILTGNRYGITSENTGNITIENGTITGKGTIPAVNVYKTGTLTIRGGSVISEGSSAVKSYDTAKIIVGTQGGGEPSKTNPLIQGKEYGVEAINGFNFYDGILKGTVDAFNGSVTPETNYIIHYGKEIIDGVQYRTATLIKDTIEIPTSGKPVITEWKIPATLDGNGLTTTIKIPIPANAKAYKVDWGDSVVEYVDAGAEFRNHLYKNTAEQTYTIKASGYIDSFGYYEEAVPTKDNVYQNYYTFTQYVTAIKDWGVIEASRYGFSNCTKLNSTIPSLKLASFKNIKDVSLLFNNCSSLDTELQKDLFSDCTQLQYFNSAFNGCSKLRGTIPRELFASNPDVRKVGRIFKGCSSLVGADIEIDSDNLTTMDEMFSGCTNIKTIVFENKFKDLVGMKMFDKCDNLKSVVMLYEYNN